ncbi:PAC2 family protein [Candidatus Bathyarchaeota archaeon]|nr:PAC2 family protein [Candidatus Bathyarchaeota archaeon]
MDTFVKQGPKVSLNNPVLVAGFPGLGYVGKITVRYMAKQLGAKRLGELYSPYFPYHIITTKGGGVRLPRAQFRYFQNTKGNDLVFCTSDSQAQSLEGQFEVVEKILSHAKSLGVRTIITIGGYSSRSGEQPKAVCIATDKKLLDRILSAGAKPSPIGNPIVGLSGVTLGMAKLMNLEAASILGETIGHLPDPESAKQVLSVLERLLDVSLDLGPLDKEIEKAMGVFKRMEDVQKEMEDLTKEALGRESRNMTYIS